MLEVVNHRVSDLWGKLRERLEQLTPAQRAAVVALGTLYVAVLIGLMFIGGDYVFQVLAHIATWMRVSRLRALVLYAGMTLAAIPPISGFGTCVTMAGMAYASVQPSEPHSWAHVFWRLMEGWMVASGGLILSASISFIALRTLLNRLDGRWGILTNIKSDRRFRALQQAVRERGLWMAVLARFCPLPYCYTNLLLASLDSLSLLVYIVSAILSAPRLLIHVFMGAKLYELIDSDVRAHQDTATKVRNIISVVIGLLLGIGSSWLIWKETSRILDLENDEPLLEEGEEEWRTEHEEGQFVLENA